MHLIQFYELILHPPLNSSQFEVINAVAKCWRSMTVIQRNAITLPYETGPQFAINSDPLAITTNCMVSNEQLTVFMKIVVKVPVFKTSIFSTKIIHIIPHISAFHAYNPKCEPPSGITTLSIHSD